MSAADKPYMVIPSGLSNTKSLHEAMNLRAKLMQNKRIKSLSHRISTLDFIGMLLMLGVALTGVIIYTNEETGVEYALFRDQSRYMMDGYTGWSQVQAWKANSETCGLGSFFLDNSPLTTWNNVKFYLTGFPVAAGTLSPWPLTFIVLFFTFFAVLLRWICSQENIPLYNPSTPNFWRWLEYFVTSPIMLTLIAVASGVRDVKMLVVLGGAQALLIMLGYLLELEIAACWDTLFYRILAKLMEVEDTVAHEKLVKMCGTAQNANKARNSRPPATNPDAEENGGYPMATAVCDQEEQQELFSAANDNLTTTVVLLHAMLDNVQESALRKTIPTLCEFHFNSRQPLLYFRLSVILLGAWAGFATIWYVIISTFYVQLDTFNNSCTPKPSGDEEMSVPGIVTIFVWGQFGLFLLFGLVSTMQAIFMYTHVQADLMLDREESVPLKSRQRSRMSSDALFDAYEKYALHSSQSFLQATMYYTILNIFAKGLLGVCIIVISTDMQGGQ